MALHLLSPREVQVAREGDHPDGGGTVPADSTDPARAGYSDTPDPMVGAARWAWAPPSAETLEASGAALKRCAAILAQAHRHLLDQKKDPLDERRADRNKAKADAGSKDRPGPGRGSDPVPCRARLSRARDRAALFRQALEAMDREPAEQRAGRDLEQAHQPDHTD